MKITLLVVGKTNFSWVKESFDLYKSRLNHYISFNYIELPELKNASALSTEQIKEKEADLLLSNIKAYDYIILLDEKGEQYRSIEFAQMLQKHLMYAREDITFIIGGAYGFSNRVYSKASLKISLSKMTFSHQMVRTIFVEQLYRAFTIIKGEPYHHE